MPATTAQASLSGWYARWYASLPGDVRSDIEAAATRICVDAGKAVIRQGDPCTGLYRVRSGELQVIGTTSNGMDALVAIHRPDDWFGFLACLDGGEYAYSVVASFQTELDYLTRAAVDRIFKASVERYQFLVQPQMMLTRSVYEHLCEHLTYTPLQRLAARLVDLAACCDEAPAPESPPLVAVTQEQLAFSSQASRQYTNRLLHQLSDLGVVRVNRAQIQISDFEKLKLIAEGELANIPGSSQRS